MRGVGGESTQVAGGDAFVVGADHAIDEADRELEPARVLEQPGETLGRRVGVSCCPTLRCEPRADQLNAALGQGQISHLDLDASAIRVQVHVGLASFGSRSVQATTEPARPAINGTRNAVETLW